MTIDKESQSRITEQNHRAESQSRITEQDDLSARVFLVLFHL